MTPQTKAKAWNSAAYLILAVCSFGLALAHVIRWAQRTEVRTLDYGLEAVMWLMFGIAWGIRFWQRKQGAPSV